MAGSNMAGSNMAGSNMAGSNIVRRARMRSTRFTQSVPGILSVCIVALFAMVCETDRAAAELLNTPVYNEATKSYFVLRAFQKGVDPKFDWFEARKNAAEHSFKGVRGRLAVVNSQQVNDFLLDTFKPKREVWIGLQYWCRYRKLMWVTGEIHPLTAYKNWHRQWHRYPARQNCHREGFAAVYYTPDGETMRWQAVPAEKFFNLYFVEYPTGKP